MDVDHVHKEPTSSWQPDRSGRQAALETPAQQRSVAAESTALRRLADAWPGRGAATLLGAPLLAVIATFMVQPKAIGFEEAEAQAVFAARASSSEDQAAPFQALQHALSSREFDRARTLLRTAPRRTVEERARSHAYSLMLECFETPSEVLRRRARRFALEQAPSDVRALLHQACRTR